MTISAACTWLSGVSSKVEETTSPFVCRLKSVTSSGRSSMSRRMSVTSGKLCEIELAMFCNNTVLPVRGGATMRPRCPNPIGVSRSTARIEMSLWMGASTRMRLVG